MEARIYPVHSLTLARLWYSLSFCGGASATLGASPLDERLNEVNQFISTPTTGLKTQAVKAQARPLPSEQLGTLDQVCLDRVDALHSKGQSEQARWNCQNIKKLGACRLIFGTSSCMQNAWHRSNSTLPSYEGVTRNQLMPCAFPPTPMSIIRISWIVNMPPMP